MQKNHSGPLKTTSRTLVVDIPSISSFLHSCKQEPADSLWARPKGFWVWCSNCWHQESLEITQAEASWSGKCEVRCFGETVHTNHSTHLSHSQGRVDYPLSLLPPSWEARRSPEAIGQVVGGRSLKSAVHKSHLILCIERHENGSVPCVVICPI